MIQLPDDIRSRDVSQWLNDGVFLVDGKRPAILRGCDDACIVVRYVDTQRSRTIPRQEVTKLWAAWPRCGSLNVGNTALYLRRRQMQQYRRTYNSRCLQIVFPNKWELLKTSPEWVQEYNDPMHKDVVLAAFNPVYPEWDEAVDKLRRQALVAINPYIILGGTARSISVFYRARKCGLVRDGEFTPVGKGLPAQRAFKLLQGRVNLC